MYLLLTVRIQRKCRLSASPAGAASTLHQLNKRQRKDAIPISHYHPVHQDENQKLYFNIHLFSCAFCLELLSYFAH